MKVPNAKSGYAGAPVSLSRLQNEGSQQVYQINPAMFKSIKATE